MPQDVALDGETPLCPLGAAGIDFFSSSADPSAALPSVNHALSEYSLEYGELRSTSLQFAGALSSVGIGAGDCVGILMGPGSEYLIAVFGLWGLGVSVLPIPLDATASQATKLLHNGNAKLAVCDAALRRKLIPGGDIPNDAAVPVVVTRGEAFGYDLSFSEMLQSRGQFSDVPKYDAGTGVAPLKVTLAVAELPKGAQPSNVPPSASLFLSPGTITCSQVDHSDGSVRRWQA